MMRLGGHGGAGNAGLGFGARAPLLRIVDALPRFVVTNVFRKRERICNGEITDFLEACDTLC
jgi:hypothetical protein